ncbi:acyltransferase domain-containing protein, partial [Myxococcota bacterium]|nr:acyltransferase domain-containing protein [Myxococcota bacterium]
MAVPPHATLVHALRFQRETRPDALCYRFLESGDVDGPITTWTHGDLHRYAAATAELLVSEGLRGKRVLLLYAPGLDFAGGFMGCLAAGAVAVPAYPPDPTRIAASLARLRAIATDAGVAAILTTAPLKMMLPMAADDAPELLAVPAFATDELDVRTERELPGLPSPDELAFLQYTSGSTGNPKGVMITQGHIVAQLGLGAKNTAGDHTSRVVTWLPQYHDLGLMTGFLMEPFLGCESTVISPVDFLKKPLRWLEAISRFGGTHAGGPDFGYALCAKKATPAIAASLDLSTWHTAFNAAEPLRVDTIDGFCSVFAASGFRPEAMMPGYGLAEATMGVTWAPHLRVAKRVEVDVAALAKNEIVREPSGRGLVLFGHGPAAPFDLAIVDPETKAGVADGRIGELWVRGPSVGLGYWGREEETERAFRAYRSDTGAGPYMRTGDLAALIDGELFITGRLSDLIILRGKNFYPHDFEWTMEAAHAAIRPGCSAAFSIEADGEERLAVVGEAKVASDDEADAIITAIRAHLGEVNGVAVHTVAIVPPRAIPKTSSGKIQRKATKRALLDGTLEVTRVWTRAPEATTQVAEPAAPASAEEAAVAAWLQAKLRAILGGGAIDEATPFASLGLDSKDSISLVADLEQHLGTTLSPTVVYDHPTIAALSKHLASNVSQLALPERSTRRDEPIAIIGMGCRFPGAKGVDALWSLLRDGVDAITEVPSDRFDVSAVYAEDPSEPGKISTRWGGFLDDVAGFDAAFFGIAPREAEGMDPQQRLLLEVAWEALEDAGVRPSALAGSDTAVSIGISSTEYGTLQFRDLAAIDGYTGTGSALSIAANRLSYVFDLHGPSYSIDTACSSSLASVHLACQALWNGESSLAIAGGVSLILSPAVTVNFTKASAMAKDGRCKTFDARADGYVRSEGVGVVILKPLSKAEADGDRIHAIIRGTAVMQDGHTNGLMAPSRKAQELVLRAAHARAGVSPAEVAYVEAHGTGTALGDTIEAEALAAALRPRGVTAEPLRVGSIKSNVGHLEAAAGVAGLMKLVLCLERGELPKSLHFETPNPHIPFAELGLAVQREHAPWPTGQVRAIGGVSSFGFGGTIAHAVVERAPRASERTEERGPFVLPISAKSKPALAQLVTEYTALVSKTDHLADVVHTAASRREHHPLRACFVGRDRTELLAAIDRGANLATQRRPGAKVFVFPGQGGQWQGMARALVEREPAFAEAIADCARAFAPFVTWKLEDVLAGGELTAIDVVQPAIFAVQVALARLYAARGVVPDAVLGHSMGEVAAAHVAGAVSLEDAARIICVRSRLMLRVAGRGAMAFAEVTLDEAAAIVAPFDGRVSIAASNGPRATVLSGDKVALERILEDLEARDVYARWIKVDVASHSREVEPILAELADALKPLAPKAPRMPFWSTVRGGFVHGAELDASYWVRNLREPVLFHGGVEALASSGHDVFVELSPHPTLTPSIESARPHALIVSSLRRDEDDVETFLGALAALWTGGVDLSFATRGRVTSLPAYPWHHQRFWSAAVERAQRSVGRESVVGADVANVLGVHVASAARAGEHLWQSELSLASHKALADHRVDGNVVVPGATYVELALAAVRELFGAGGGYIEDLRFDAPLVLEASAAVRVQVVAEPTGPRSFELAVHAQAPGSDAWVRHARARLVGGGIEGRTRDVERAWAELGETVDVDGHFEALARIGLEYGPAFRRVAAIARSKDAAIVRLATGSRVDAAGLDAGFHASAALARVSDAAFVLSGAARVAVGGGGAPAWAEARPAAKGADVAFYDERGELVLEVRGLEARPIERADRRPVLHELAWREQALDGAERARRRIGIVALDDARARALADVLTNDGHDVSVIHGAATGLDHVVVVAAARAEGDLGRRAIDHGAWRTVLPLVQELSRMNAETRLWLVTSGAQAVGGAELSIEESPLWGLGPVLAAEHAELRPVCVDLDPARGREGLVALAAELAANGAEDRIAYRDGRRFVARLAPVDAHVRATAPLGASEGFALDASRRGVIDALTFTRLTPRAPGPGDVCITVRAAGLNFSDVLKALGVYPGDAPLGAECAGVISAIGPGVEGLAVGDEVVAIAPGCFASEVVTHAALVAKKPAGTTFEAAATLPIAQLTASWSLETLGRIRRGDRVLIHSATGGVGLAAIAIARRVGAEIFATAGSDAKRAWLASQGVAHVFDSRTTVFAEIVRAR